MSCETISVRKLDYYVNNPYACIIDLRDDSEYAFSHIKNAYHIPYKMLVEYLDSRQGSRSIEKLLEDKRKTYIVYCDRGAMSMIICNKMSKQGYITKTVVGGFHKYNGRYVVH